MYSGLSGLVLQSQGPDVEGVCLSVCSFIAGHSIQSKISKSHTHKLCRKSNYPARNDSWLELRCLSTWIGLSSKRGVTPQISEQTGCSYGQCGGRSSEEIAERMNLTGFVFFLLPKLEKYLNNTFFSQRVVHGLLKHWLRIVDWVKQIFQIHNLNGGHFPFLLCLKNNREFWKISSGTPPGETQIKH